MTAMYVMVDCHSQPCAGASSQVVTQKKKQIKLSCYEICILGGQGNIGSMQNLSNGYQNLSNLSPRHLKIGFRINYFNCFQFCYYSSTFKCLLLKCRTHSFFQFEKKSIYDMHLLLIHNHKNETSSLSTVIKNEPLRLSVTKDVKKSFGFV